MTMIGPQQLAFFVQGAQHLGTTAWYCRQNIRLSDGHAPDPDMRVPMALLRHQITALRVARARRLVLQAGG